MKVKGIELKPGMIVVTKCYRWIVFPTQIELSLICFEENMWYRLSNFLPKYENHIEKIIELCDGQSLNNGKVLWKKGMPIKYTKQEIADILRINESEFEIVD